MCVYTGISHGWGDQIQGSHWTKCKYPCTSPLMLFNLATDYHSIYRKRLTLDRFQNSAHRSQEWRMANGEWLVVIRLEHFRLRILTISCIWLRPLILSNVLWPYHDNWLYLTALEHHVTVICIYFIELLHILLFEIPLKYFSSIFQLH